MENLLQQMKANKRKLAAWEAQQEEQRHELEEQKRLEEVAKIMVFQYENQLGVTSSKAKEIQEMYKEQVKRNRERNAVKSVVNIEQNKEQIRDMKVRCIEGTASILVFSRFGIPLRRRNRKSSKRSLR